MIVLDTHVLVWTDTDDRKLGRKARALINRFWGRGEVAVSALSFWELAQLQARGRIMLPMAADTWRVQLLDAGLIEFPVDGVTGIRAVQLNGLPEDPADRLIAATAIQHRAELMTADDAILAWKHPLVRRDARA